MSTVIANDRQALPYATADRKRRKLRVAIVTENFLPKVDGVTRTLARLLEHLNAEGHEAIVFGPDTGLRQYAGHAVEGTFGVPLIVYPGLKLNFMRPRFVRRLQQFKPDVVHFVDPIWLGAQMLPVVQKWLPEVPCVASYHTNLPTYATLFGMPWLEETMWKLTRSLHGRCQMVFCPSESTRRMLQGKGFKNVEIWSRGVDTTVFNPAARDDNLRSSWGCTPKPIELQSSLSSNEQKELALVQLASKLGIQVSRNTQTNTPMARRRSLAAVGVGNGSPDDESFIRTPPSGPSLTGSPEFSPPPSYDSLANVPDLPGGAFALPPPALATPEPSAAPNQLSKTVVLYVGRISWEKNIRLLIEAFKLLPNSVRANAKLVFVGDGPARGDLTRLCQRYKLDAAFMGHQKGKRLAAMYASASVFAFPSFTETFGQVVLEALASGLPVVGLHAEGTSDLVSHGTTGLLLDVKEAVARKAASTPPSPGRKPFPPTVHASPRLAALRSSERLPVCKPSTFTAPEPNHSLGLPTPIPSVADFAASMQGNSDAFETCAKAYSSLLERLIRDRTLRTVMGQRAQIQASRKSWWDAMDAVVRGYETVVQANGTQNLSDEELEALRREQQMVAPLTGPIVKLSIVTYILLFLAFCSYMLRA
jgi:glycosyltransferase involved in cell wall biosynthesis